MSFEMSQQGRRNKARYNPVDFNSWKLKVDGKTCPAQWIVDINDHAIRIRMGQYGIVKEGDVITLSIESGTGTIFKGQAKVMWKTPCSEGVNLFDLGLKFLSHPLRPLPDGELNQDNQFVNSMEVAAMEKPANQFLLAVALPFLVGFVWQWPAIQSLLH